MGNDDKSGYAAEERYYDAVTDKYPRMNENARAYNHWFRETQPEHEYFPRVLPLHSRAMSSLKAKMIMATFVTRLINDVQRCSIQTWMSGPLPADDQIEYQPLGDGKIDQKLQGDADQDPDDYDFEPDPNNLAEKRKWVVDVDGLQTVENMLQDLSLQKSGGNMLAEQANGVSKTGTMGTHFITKLEQNAPKAMMMTISKGIWGWAMKILIDQIEEWLVKKLDDWLDDADKPVTRRRKRLRGCVDALMNILMNAQDYVANGYAANRALVTNPKDKRTKRTYRSRR